MRDEVRLYLVSQLVASLPVPLSLAQAVKYQIVSLVCLKLVPATATFQLASGKAYIFSLIPSILALSSSSCSRVSWLLLDSPAT